MRLLAWAWLALSSASFSDLQAAMRPRYGGTLTVDLSGEWTAIEPADWPAELALPVAETLVKLNARGQVESELAVAWQPDADRKRWRFSLRPKVVFHDGEPLTAANAVPALLAVLKKKYGDVSVTAGGQTIIVQSGQAMTDLLADLARPQMAIYRRTDASPLIGTGPFRVASWERGRRLTLAAFDDHWRGRPFLDSVVISLAASQTRADVFDIPIAGSRRVLPGGARTWTSPPRELIALLAANPQSTLLQALALAVDRAPIVNVLTQRRGEPAFGLLPQWLTGYAFLFQTTPDSVRAKQLISQLRLAGVSLSYPANDSFARAVADRVALNARDAGIVLQPTSNPGGNLTVVRWSLQSMDAATELARLCTMLGIAERTSAIDVTRIESLHDVEQTILEEHRLIPLVYLPQVFAILPRVHGWESAQKETPFRLNLERVWVDP
jgi:peptide/nickel transport system substrate-binding protein